MQLLKDLQNKVALIEWRDKVEEIIEKLQKNEKIYLEQIQIILEEGLKSGFILKEGDKFLRNGELSLLCNFDSLDELMKTYQDS